MVNEARAAAPQALAALLQLEKHALAAPTPAALGFVVANETQSLVAYRQAAVFGPAANGQYRMMTASGLVSVTEDSPFAVWLNRFAQKFPKETGCHRLNFSEAPREFSEGWQEWLPDHLLVATLHGAGGQVAGLVMYAREAPWQDAELSLLDRLHLAYGYCLSSLSRQQRNLAVKIGQILRGRAKWVWLALLAALFIPVRLSALAPAEVVALNAMAVAAPQDGVIGAIYVQPIDPAQVIHEAAYATLGSPKYFFTRSGVCSSIVMCSVAAALSFALVRTGTFDVMTCLRSAFNLSSGLSSGL